MAKVNFDEARDKKYVLQYINCYHPGISPEDTMALLSDKSDGTFLLRPDPDLDNNAYVILSYKEEGKINHQLLCIRYGVHNPQVEGSLFVNIVDYLEENQNKFSNPIVKADVKHFKKAQEKLPEKEAAAKKATAEMFKDKFPKEIGEEIGSYLAHEANPLARMTKATARVSKDAKKEAEIKLQQQKEQAERERVQEINKTKALACYNSKLDTAGAVKALEGKEIGSYLLRDSSFDKKKPEKDFGHYFAISYVDEDKKVGHYLIYVPEKKTLGKDFGKSSRKLNLLGNAILVPNIEIYLREKSHLFKTPLITDPDKQQLKQPEHEFKTTPKQ